MILDPQTELFHPVQCVQVVPGGAPITVTLTICDQVERCAMEPQQDELVSGVAEQYRHWYRVLLPVVCVVGSL